MPAEGGEGRDSRDAWLSCCINVAGNGTIMVYSPCCLNHLRKMAQLWAVMRALHFSLSHNKKLSQRELWCGLSCPLLISHMGNLCICVTSPKVEAIYFLAFVLML